MASKTNNLPLGARPKTSRTSSRGRRRPHLRHEDERELDDKSNQHRTSVKMETRSVRHNAETRVSRIKDDSVTPRDANFPRPKSVSEHMRNNTPRRNGEASGSQTRSQDALVIGRPRSHSVNNRNQTVGRYIRAKSGVGRGRGRSNSLSSTHRRGRQLGERRLKELLQQEPTEIVMELATEKSGCKELLDKVTMGREMVVLLLEIMAKACLCTSSPKNLNSFLAFVWQSAFLSQHLTQFVSSLLREATEEGNIELQPVRHLLKLLECLLEHLPSSSSEVGVITILLEGVFRDNNSIPAEIKEQVARIKDNFEMIESQSTARAERAMLKSQYQAPPNNFRDIHIIPGIKELRKDKRPFLRHNLINGQYEGVDHYLDVQFRLLREDFVAPLREGIAEYLRNQEEFEDDPRRRLQDVRLYHDVSIIRPTMTRAGPGHLIEFDMSSFKRIRWESSKRLINGSLLCLTKDNFQTVFYATVEGRDVRQLQKGRLEVKFLRLPDVLGVAADVKFLMAETSAYFESYRYVLEGLQGYDRYNLPLQSYIVDVSAQKSPPMYLHDDIQPRYDLRPVIQRKKDVEDLATSDVRTRTTQACLRSVRILEPGAWPDAETLNFDESQLEAFRAALSSEFVLIQGPPGTGKTYVGLEIVKTLLFNFHMWSDTTEEQWDFRPILVVCFTNHALDQFLEGIYQYEKGIVRVGGRCQSESLQACNIVNIRKKKKASRDVPDHVHHRRADMQEYYDMRDILDAAHERIALAQTGIVQARILYEKKIIPLVQYRSLISRTLLDNDPMYDWLGLDGRGLPKEQSGHNASAEGAQEVNNIDSDDDSEDEFHIMEEAELLAEQRQLGNDPTFIQHREESLINLVSEFAFVPGKRGKNESKTDRQDRRKIEKKIEFAISHQDVLTAIEVEGIRDAWQIPYHQRWKLYRYWCTRYVKLQEKTMLIYQTTFERLSEERKEIDREEDYLILKEARVIGMTTTGAAKNRILLQRVRPKIIVVEEAAEVLEAHIITTLSRDCQHLILIGDHQQLRPNPTVYRLAKNYNLDVSLFERMINNGLPCYRLGMQHRMRPEISCLMKEHFYKGLEDHDSVMHYEPIMGVTTNMFILEHGHKELQIDDTKSKSNLHEAKFLVELCHYFLKQGYEPTQITVLTTYTGQLFNFKKLMNKEQFEGVRVSVVDNFQGEENDIILLSLVRSNEGGSIGFLKVANRVCVALSRAKKGLFCIGNIKLLAEQSALWKGILNTATETGQVGATLPLVCQNHPETITNVSRAEDFAQVPDGGCMLRCDARLECGHACESHCHPKDPNHEEYKCMKDCSTVCTRGHKCTLKCFEECNCPKMLRKLFVKCQHTYLVKCHEIETAICQKKCVKKLSCNHDCPSICGESCPVECNNPCPKKMQCGHRCRKMCGRPCSSQQECWEIVTVTLPKCGHTCSVECKNNRTTRAIPQYPPCQSFCERPLKCGHPCDKMCTEPCQKNCNMMVKKTCASCDHTVKIKCQDAANAVCLQPCKRNLSCGHSCPKLCKEQCETICNVGITKTWPTCDHSIKIKCREATNAVCRKPCRRPLPCRHRCIKPCGIPCDSAKCNLPCQRLLPCKHPCPKKCGEPCESSNCNSPCQRLLPCKHQCRMKCKEPCESSKCNLPCQRLLPCKHRCRKKCGEPCETLKCDLPCQRLLPCNHQCPKKCGEPCVNRCIRKMLKTLPKCEHVMQVPCYADVKTVECLGDCRRTLPCGHTCKGICGKPCTITCQEKTVKLIPKCGHKVTLSCDQEPKHSLCKDKCLTRFTCGHFCQRPCGQRCEETCGMMVSKELPDCKHQQNMSCIADPKSVKCDFPCEKVLPCTHKCYAKCGDPCTSVCQVKVIKKHPKCFHLLKLECHEDVSQTTCKEPCKNKLLCGHNCPRMCFEPCKTEMDASESEKKEDGGWNKMLLDFFRGTVSTRWPLCNATVLKIHPVCGHQIKLPCFENPENIPCQSPCKKPLPCGHPCPNLCGASCGISECKFIVNKTNLRCGHKTKMVCNEDPLNSICQEPCTRKRSCGHQCLKLCSEPCETSADVCQVKVTKKLLCNHVMKLNCHEDPSRVACQNPCEKELKCGHKCFNSCWEECEKKCRVKVHKVITKCGHTAKVPCHLDPDSGQFCVKKCKELLLCGHPCEEKCGKPCTKSCKVKVVKILPSCNHPAKDIECHQEPSAVVCKERCNKLLNCGHDCKNVCGECSHSGKARGTSLSMCKEICRKPLRCGHQCQSKCSYCFGGRIHQPCLIPTKITLLCGCILTEECSKVVSASHTPYRSDGFCLLLSFPRTRTRSRESIQNDIDEEEDTCKHNSSHGYCEEPCQELLPCMHTCIGVCGEPCPKLCRFCNRRQVLQIFPEFQVESDPCYIQLRQCEHIFERTELDRKLSVPSQSNGCVPIVPVTCPKCGMPIEEKRFIKHAVNVKEDVKWIDGLINDERKMQLRVAKNLLSQSQYKYKQQPFKRDRPEGRRRKNVSQAPRQAQANMVWKLNFLEVLRKMNMTKLPKQETKTTRVCLIKQCQDMKRALLPEVRTRLERMLDNETSLTEQLADDLGCELERLQWCGGFERLVLTLMDKTSMRGRYGRIEGEKIKKAVDILTSPRRFTVERRQEVILTLGASLNDELTDTLRMEPRNLDREKLLDLQKKQKGFLVGEWFKCPRDHVFHYRTHHKQSDSAGKLTESEAYTPSCPSCLRKPAAVFRVNAQKRY